MIKKLKIAFLKWLLKDIQVMPIPGNRFEKSENKRLKKWIKGRRAKQSEIEKKEKKRIYMQQYHKRRQIERMREEAEKALQKTTLSKYESRRLYEMAYHQRPEVKAKRKAYYKKWYAKKKAKKENSFISIPTLNGFEEKRIDEKGSILG